MQPIIPREIDVSDLAQLRRDQTPYRLLDVREPWEVAICSLPDSLCIPMQQVPREIDKIDALPRDSMLVVVCHHGMRSATVANFLRQNGFDNACNLAGGIDAWARLIDPAMARY